VILYVDENTPVAAPQIVNGVRTLVIPANARAVSAGSAPLAPQDAAVAALPGAALNQAVNLKQQVAQRLMKQNQAFFGVGVGQSLDNPKEAALVIYVDRKYLPSNLPQTIEGLRTHYVVMDRMHVTRSYATGLQSRSRCKPPSAKSSASRFGSSGFDPANLLKPLGLNPN